MVHSRTLSTLLVIVLLVPNLLLSIPASEPSTSYRLASEGATWTYADLRRLDPPDAPHPTQDIIAAYLQFIRGESGFRRLFNFWQKFPTEEIRIRLDILDLDILSSADIYLAIDHQPGGLSTLPGGNRAQINWDTMIVLPAQGAIQAWDDQHQDVQDLSIRILRDPVLDTLVIILDAIKLPGAAAGFSLQIFTTELGTEKIVDQLDAFRLSDRPSATAPLLFVFWNTFPAYTSALALRRWDGAHTGPLGGRHGLYNLLRLARNHKIVLALLDLKSPVSLSALDYVEGLPIVRRMAAEGLLILPDAIPEAEWLHETPPDFITFAADTSRQIALAFQLPASQFIYSRLDNSVPDRYPIVMTKLPASKFDEQSNQVRGTLFRWRDKTVIAIPNELPPEQVTLDGISLNIRKALILIAIANQSRQNLGEAHFLLLGGDLPNSEWGAPQFAGAGFRYINAHPWMRPLGAHDLTGVRPATLLAENQNDDFPSSKATPENLGGLIPQYIDTLIQLPQDSLTQAAWQSLFSLSGPLTPHPPELDYLRLIYAGQLGVLLQAAHWAANPQAISSCVEDIDLDGQVECLLASDNVFTAFKAASGVLTHMFVRTPSGFHQVVAPSSQFVAGLSEASSWNLANGFNADPAVIPGAFSIETTPLQPMLSAGRLSFSGDKIDIIYQLTSNGLIVDFRTAHQSISTHLPLALDPWTRNIPAWGERYVWAETDHGWQWEIEDGPGIQVRTNAQLIPSLFNQTRKMMAKTENPNFEFPPSHFLPFPLALLTLDAPGDFFVEISLTD